MTPKQEERIRIKIARIRKELAYDKKHWGGYYHDGRGLRYLPPELFVKLRDYKGGLRYLRWFNKAFPNDVGYPFFLFEWTLILFKTGNIKEAEKLAFRTFLSNNFLFDKFLGKESLLVEIKECASSETKLRAENLPYSKSDAELADFAEWLERFMTNEKFHAFANELLEINQKLAIEPAGRKRSALVNRLGKLIE
jgi:hypothetical protein